MGLRTPFTILRATAVAAPDAVGDGQAPPREALSILATVQPLNYRDIPDYLAQRDGGDRVSKAYKVYTSTQLVVGDDQAQPDLIVIDGENYELRQAGHFRSGVISHCKAVALRYTQQVIS